MSKAPPKKSASKKPALRKSTATKVKSDRKAAPNTAPDMLAALDAAAIPDSTVLDRLFTVVSSRKGTDPAISHSARLLSRGTHKIAQKFGEEAVECLIEAVAGRKNELIGESADVLYHLIVMWVDAGVAPQEVWAELARREGVSGIAEKASRPKVMG